MQVPPESLDSDHGEGLLYSHRGERGGVDRQALPVLFPSNQTRRFWSQHMDHQELNRRDFNRLTMAAFGGVVAGAVAGCGEEKKPAPAPMSGGPSASHSQPPAHKGEEVAAAAIKGEPHACRGLNACKGQGATGKNDCAGQGECATKAWHHSCSGQNDCKGQGGCGEDATQNDCKTKGSCSVPLMDSVWNSARKHFEEEMEKAGKEVGEAPPKKTT